MKQLLTKRKTTIQAKRKLNSNELIVKRDGLFDCPFFFGFSGENVNI